MATMRDKDFEVFKTAFIPKKEEKKSNDDVEALLDPLIEKGNNEMDKENFEDAILTFSKSIDIIPSPKETWETYWWLNASLGDAYFQIGKFEEALGVLNIAYRLSDAEPNPFILLRLGQCYYDTNKFQMAVDFLLRAYMLDGEGIFDHEEKHYLNFLKSEVKI